MAIAWEATDFITGALVYSDVHGFGKIVKTSGEGSDRRFEIIFMLMVSSISIPYSLQEIQRDLYPVRPMSKLYQAFTEFSMQVKALKEN